MIPLLLLMIRLILLILLVMVVIPAMSPPVHSPGRTHPGLAAVFLLVPVR